MVQEMEAVADDVVVLEVLNQRGLRGQVLEDLHHSMNSLVINHDIQLIGYGWRTCSGTGQASG